MNKIVVLLTLVAAALLAAPAHAGNGTAKLTWGAVTTDVNGATLPAGSVTYNIYQGLSSASMVKVKTGITGLGFTLSGLDDFTTTYYFYITATNTAGESDKSATVSKTMPAPPLGKPNAPTGVAAQ